MLFRSAQALDVPIYLHPGPPHQGMVAAYYADYLQDFPSLNTAAWCFTIDTASQAVRLILSGLFEEYPRLKIILGHMGEGLPYLVDRVDEAVNRQGSNRVAFKEIFCRNFYVTTSGHLLGSPAGRFADRPPPTYTGPFHDPFVLFGFLAAITQRIHFRPSILILPLYATAIVAKQSAELQMLSVGRFELGVGVSWNPAEYAAVGQGFTNRGRRVSEQVMLLRRLWSEPYVTFYGPFHHFDALGLNRVVTPPIPIWMGGSHEDRVLRRIARLADGFIPLGPPAEPMSRLRRYLKEFGRDPDGFGLTARLVAGSEGPAGWLESARGLREIGATHLTIGAPADLAAGQALERIIEAQRVLSDGL